MATTRPFTGGSWLQARRLCGVTALALGFGAYTTLAPTPLTTGLSARPADRTEVTVQAGSLPGYFLSASTTSDPGATSLGHGALAFEPGPRWRLPGLLVGARVIGPGHDRQYEPILGYRRVVGAHGGLALAAFASGTHAKGADSGASYTATRVGGEVAADLRLLVPRRWIELHVMMSLATVYTTARGTYCVDDQGFGADCPSTGPVVQQEDELDVLSPAASVGLGLDLRRTYADWFHGGRVALMFSLGTMPRVRDGMQDGSHRVASGGIVLSLAFGAAR